MQLPDKTAVVTGAASGIGRATATAFADAGCDVVLVDIDEPRLEQARDEIAATRPDRTVRARVVDVGDAEAVQDLADRVADEFGAVHVLVNNAGINVTGAFDDHSIDDFRRTFDVNFWGVVHGCHSFLPHMLEAGEGWMVNISSMFGLLGVAEQTSYCASKFAVRGFSESLHEELADGPVGVSAVYPGAIDTNIIENAIIHNTELADDMLDYFADYGCAPKVVADHIVDAVHQERHRVLITPEARASDYVRRLVPTLGNRFANWLIAKLV